MSTRGAQNKAKGQQSTVRKKKTESEPKKDVKKLEPDLEKAKKENGSLKKELEKCRFDLVTLQKNFNYEEVRKVLPEMMNNDGLQADQGARLMKDIAELRKELDVLREKKGKQELPTKNEPLKMKQKEYDNLMIRVNELQTENEQLKIKLKEYDQDMASFRNLKDEYAQLESKFNELQKKMTIAEAEKPPLKSEQGEHKTVTQLEEERDKLEKHRNQIERELNEANDEIKRLTSQLADSTNSNDKESSIKELTESQKEVATLKSKLEATEKLHQNEKGEKERELTETKEQLKDLKSSFEKIEQSYEDEKREMERLQEKMSKKQTGTEREKKLLAEIENLKTRLSELASAQLMTNNPNVADLSDSNRPTKLAEQYSELYDNEWTNAYEFLEKTGLSEVKITQNLRGILVNSFKFCTEVSKEQTKQLKLALTTVPGVKNGKPITDDSIIPTKLRQLRELRKAFAPDMIDDVFQSYKKEKKPQDIDKVQVRDYTHKCITLSWFMSVQDPPVVIDTENHTGNFDSDIFRTYTKTGALIDHVVWPPLYLHDGGRILCKGVAQAK